MAGGHTASYYMLPSHPKGAYNEVDPLLLGAKEARPCAHLVLVQMKDRGRKNLTTRYSECGGHQWSRYLGMPVLPLR